ncbi:hypothetical protein CLV47_101208 [Antricoccus suffuscus]|uniref:DUF3558 domain-containing protein n=1 Tax=Antricoccus suffuscus TaxID=1629062 RepID=A0A2T1A6A1_9ACTN|nr:hypothetical protein [Antricoccus suffuscus]PRZ44084.1 hypothetical protein CLV47_101208 [Antricoccus suffuscus]
MKRLKLLVALMAAAGILLGGCATSGAATTGAGSTASSVTAGKGGPTDSALMVCGEEPASSITQILGLDKSPHKVHTWANKLYTCTYHLPMGEFVLSVKESADDAAAIAYFNDLQTKLAPTTPIEGLANLGFPAYNTTAGATVFVKDNMTLQVDASKLPATLGPHNISRNDLSYQVATVILACWKEHQ